MFIGWKGPAIMRYKNKAVNQQSSKHVAQSQNQKKNNHLLVKNQITY